MTVSALSKLSLLVLPANFNSPHIILGVLNRQESAGFYLRQCGLFEVATYKSYLIQKMKEK